MMFPKYELRISDYGDGFFTLMGYKINQDGGKISIEPDTPKIPFSKMSEVLTWIRKNYK